jgi:hypothetical protein
MFLRLPELRDLAAEDRALLTRTIGGHPRLIEFTDALLRGGHANLRQVQNKLRDLARKKGIDLAEERSLQQAAEQAMVLGSADILLTELLALLTPRQTAILHQVAVSRAPMIPGDLHFALATGPDPATAPPGPTAVRADANHLAGLTLLTTGDSIVMHPWTAELITRNAGTSLTGEHQRALAMRWQRFKQSRGNYDDLIDIARHQAALGRYDDLTNLAIQAVQTLPGTLAVIAYLAEVRPLIPPGQRAWVLVADHELQAFLNAGDLPAATRQQQAIHEQNQAWLPPTPPTPNGGAICPSATNGSATSPERPGIWPPPAPPTRPPRPSARSWPPPTPPMPNGSGICKSSSSGSPTC